MPRPRWLHAVPTESPPPEGPPPLRDAELIAGVQRGDDRLSAELYDRVAGVVDRTLYRVFGRRESDHEDLVQSTFEQIVVTLSRRRFAAACSLSTWASTIATHVGLNALRSRRRERRVVDRDADVDEAPGSEHAERSLEARSDVARLRGHLAAMDEDKANTLFLHDALGHDLAEVAVLTGVSVAAAQSRLVRGRKDLLERLERDRTRGEETR